MKKNVLVQIIGTQQLPDGQEDRIEFVTPGTYYRRKGIYYVSYREAEHSGLEGVMTLLRVESDNIVLQRIGRAELRQEYRKQALCPSVYVTPYGKLPMSILTEAIDSDLTVQGGRISLKYDLFVDNEFVSHNGLMIIIKEDLSQ